MIIKAFKASDGATVTVRKESNGRTIIEVYSDHPLDLLAAKWRAATTDKERGELHREYRELAMELNDLAGKKAGSGKVFNVSLYTTQPARKKDK